MLAEEIRYFSCQSYLELLFWLLPEEEECHNVSQYGRWIQGGEMMMNCLNRGVEYALQQNSQGAILFLSLLSLGVLAKNTDYGWFWGNVSLLRFFCLYVLIQTASDCCSPKQCFNKQLVWLLCWHSSCRSGISEDNQKLLCPIPYFFS